MGITAAILGLAVLVLVHEAGHFFAARWVGMRPRKFYLGFGTPIVKKTRNGVEYGIGALPLGGYVKIPGMNRAEAGDLRRSLKPEEAEPVEAELDALDAAIERGDDEAALAMLPPLEPALEHSRVFRELEGQLAPDAYWRQSMWKKIVVIAAGPLVNIVVGIALFAVSFMMGSTQITATVGAVQAEAPAAQAGLRAGDKIVAVDGRTITEPENISASIRGTGGKPFTMVVRRDGAPVTIGPVRARIDQGVYRIGFALRGIEGPGESPPQATWHAVRLMGDITVETGKVLGSIAQGERTDEISSVVGITRVTSDAYRESARYFVAVVAYISLALALLNLLPVLPLDGGHIVMAVLERIRGRSFSQLTYMRYAIVGLTIFAFLLYLGLRNDLSG